MTFIRSAALALAACVATIGAAAAEEDELIILVSNDDGYENPGLRAAAAALNERATVVIVAPKTNQSGMSSAISGVGAPMKWSAFDFDGADEALWIDARPAVAVMWGVDYIRRTYGRGPDLVLSGINPGANLGASVFYSGTVGAAREGAINGVPSIAASLDRGPSADLDGAAKRLAGFALRYAGGEPCGCFIAVNFPGGPITDDTPAEIVGFDRAPIRIAAETDAEKGETLIRISLGRENAAPDTDIAALAAGKIAITPVALEAFDPAKIGRLLD